MDDYPIGILMLNTSFARPIGDIGNAHTFSFPVVYKIVEAASISRVVTNRDPRLLDIFIEAAKELEATDVKAITTSCGFLAIYQKEIQKHLSIPFFSSSLLQVPLLQAMTDQSVGIITASESSLTKQHLQAVHIDTENVVIKGMDDMPYFSGAIIQEKIALQEKLVREEMKQVAQNVMGENPQLQAIVLECTNMPPYREVISEVADIPVFDIVTLTNYMYATL